jgi:hypothetical protein
MDDPSPATIPQGHLSTLAIIKKCPSAVPGPEGQGQRGWHEGLLGADSGGRGQRTGGAQDLGRRYYIALPPLQLI